MQFLPVLRQACCEFLTWQKAFRRTLQNRISYCASSWMLPILVVLQQFSNHWLLYVVRQNYDKVHEERCSYILPVRYCILNSNHFLHANSTQMACHNWMQSMVTIATIMCLLTGVAVHCPRHTSALGLSAHQCLINFETAAHFRELVFYFFNKCLKGRVHLFHLQKLLRLIYNMIFCVK